MSVTTDESPLQSSTNPAWDWRGMRKSHRDNKVAGVCGGFGEHTPVPSWLWRVLFLTTFVCGGIGLVAYVVLWICMPPPASRY